MPDIRKPITNESTKGEEFGWIEAVADKCLDGSYLSTLFTAEFMAWIAQRIKSDLTLDVMDTIAGRNEAISNQAAQIGNLQTAAKNQERARQETEHETTVTMKALRDKLNAKQAAYEGKCTEAGQGWANASAEKTQNVKANRKINELENTVMQLKARLFDIMEANAATE